MEKDIQQKILEVLEEQERHQRYFSTVLTVYIVLQVIAVGIYLVALAIP